MLFSVTFMDLDGFYNHKLLEAENATQVQEYMESKGYTEIKIEERN